MIVDLNTKLISCHKNLMSQYAVPGIDPVTTHKKIPNRVYVVIL